MGRKCDRAGPAGAWRCGAVFSSVLGLLEGGGWTSGPAPRVVHGGVPPTQSPAVGGGWWVRPGTPCMRGPGKAWLCRGCCSQATWEADSHPVVLGVHALPESLGSKLGEQCHRWPVKSASPPPPDRIVPQHSGAPGASGTAGPLSLFSVFTLWGEDR